MTNNNHKSTLETQQNQKETTIMVQDTYESNEPKKSIFIIIKHLFYILSKKYFF